MKSIRHRIILMSLVVSLVVATGLVSYWTFSMRSVLADKNNDYVETLARELSLTIDGFLHKQKGYLEGQTEALIFKGDYSREFLSLYTVQVHEGNPYSLYVYFNTPTDQGHFTSSDGWIPPEEYSWENRYWIPILAELETVFVGPPHRDSVTNRIVTLLRKRVFDSEFQGVLNSAIDLTELSEIVNDFSMPFKGRAFLLNEDGKLITFDDPNLLINVEDVPVISDLIAEFDVSKDNFRIDSFTYISAPLKEANWTIWVEVPTKFFMTGLLQTSVKSSFVYFIALIIAIMLSYWLGNRLSVPIVRLKVYSQLISEGNYTIDIAPELLHARSEIGEFAMSFQHMKQNVLERQLELMKAMSALKSTNEELEHRNSEIQALYEEQAATEETLRENYDELERYKDHIVYQTTHNINTGLCNREQLYNDLIQINNQSSLANRGLLFISFSEREHYLQTLSSNLVDQVHDSLARDLVQRFSDVQVGEVYDLSLGQFAVLSNVGVAFNKIRDTFESLHYRWNTMEVMETLTLKISIFAGGYRFFKSHEPSDFKPESLLDFVQAAYHDGALKCDLASLREDGFIFWYNDRMYQERQLKLRIEQDLHKAIENREFYVVYQPQYNSEGGIVAAEALVRWKHPKLGLISPDLFIKTAEEIGVIDAIDLFVLDDVTNVLVQLRENTIDIPISINTSLLEWLDPFYLEDLNTKMKMRGLPKESIAIEITETAFSENLDIVRNNLYKFVEAGYRVHLDDFGTGYSSLMYLANFPIECLKIDRQFIDKIEEKGKVHSMIKGVIELAHSLNMYVVAEGVETRGQLELLKQLHCDLYQGFYLSKPLDELTFKRLLGLEEYVE